MNHLRLCSVDNFGLFLSIPVQTVEHDLHRIRIVSHQSQIISIQNVRHKGTNCACDSVCSICSGAFAVSSFFLQLRTKKIGYRAAALQSLFKTTRSKADLTKKSLCRQETSKNYFLTLTVTCEFWASSPKCLPPQTLLPKPPHY